MNKQVIRITGASSGIWRATAKMLGYHWHTVYATLHDVTRKNRAVA